jgi:hypothetical protein
VSGLKFPEVEQMIVSAAVDGGFAGEMAGLVWPTGGWICVPVHLAWSPRFPVESVIIPSFLQNHVVATIL